MWTPETRTKYDRRDLRYPSDLRNEEWAEIEPLLPKPSGRGRPREYLLREIINGIRYVLRYGIPWDAMPKDLPPWYVAYDSFRKLAKGGQLDQINHQLVMKEREKSGREPSPTLVIIDCQTIKCDAPQGERGYDGAKKIKGRKRHVAVDTGGRTLARTVTTADIQDQDAGLELAERVTRCCPWVERFVVDSGYKKRFCDGVRDQLGRQVEIVERPKDSKGFVLLPKRWKVEQMFGVIVQNRRLRVDYESLIVNSLAMLTLASIFRLITSLVML